MTRFAMFRNTCVSLTAAFVVAAGVANAEADSITKFKIGGWEGGAYTTEAGEFSHCAAKARYKSGIDLLFAVDRQQQWSMGFAKNTWQLTPGDRHQIKYKVDSGPVLSGTATARTTKLAQVPLPPNRGLFKAMRRGNLLQVAAGQDVLKFRLTTTSRMLKALLDCSVKHKRLAKQSSNPFAASSGNRSGPTPQSRREATARARAVMEKTGAPFEFANPDKLSGPYVKHDAVWTMGPFIGTMRILRSPSKSAIEKALVADDAQTCNGSFASRTLSADQAKVGRTVASCVRNDGSRWDVYYSIYGRDADSSYVLTVFSTKTGIEKVAKLGDYLAETAAYQAGIEEGVRPAAFN